MTTEKPKKVLRPASVRYGGFLTELKALLANGEWTSLAGVELTNIHDVDSTTMKYLTLMGMVEVRKDEAKKARGGRLRQYKATEALSGLMTFQLIEAAQKFRKEANEEYLARQKAFGHRERTNTLEYQKDDTPPIESPADTIPEQSVESTNEASPTTDQTEPSTSRYLLLRDGRLVEEVFTCVADVEDYLDHAVILPGHTFIVAKIVETIEAKVQLIRHGA